MPSLPLVRRVKILENEMDALRELPERMTAVEAALVAIREEIRLGDEETRRQMRVLHEDLIGRIALLQEGVDGRNDRSGAAAKRKRSPHS